eukprot:TRINITY_DN2319_c0_g1_i1.p1 TRINITY_DN2319_c0_g1~~TRINITY_DN2319_c0_g1_i1.p1  ORF type:complete len:316 (+),score=74.06 TRINITY_DN2319_c0_g1_i1:78-1025(+)
MDEKKEVKKLSPLQHGFCGLFAGTSSSIVFYPLHLVQTRFQVQPRGNEGVYKGFGFRAIKHIVKTEGKGILGIRPLYQGLTPAIFGSASAWGTYFIFYNKLKDIWRKKFDDSNDKMSKLSPKAHMICAFAGGFGSAILTNPIWVIKTRMQLQTYNDPSNYKNMFDAFRSIYQKEGIKGLYKGLVPSLFGVTHGSIQFVIYEEMKHLFVKFNNKNNINQKTDYDLSFIQGLISGGLSKIAATTATYPYGVIKSRIQALPSQASKIENTSGVIKLIITTLKKEKFLGFYRGYGVCILRVTPASAFTFACYEAIKNLF